MSVDARRVTVDYGSRRALDGASFRAAAGEIVGLIGPNGSGKTTMLRSLYKAIRPSGGSVLIDGDDVADLRPRHLARRVAVVVQDPVSELAMTVAEMVLLGRAPQRGPFLSYDVEDHRVAAELLTQVGLRDRADDLITELSGGERQRVLLARALAQDVDHLFLDEPTNHLDVRYQHELLDLVCRLASSVVIVLHDLNLAARYCDRLVLLNRGAVIAEGLPSEVLHPERIESVYGISVRRVDGPDGVPQLVYGQPRVRLRPN
ncbi:MAG: ABC transporter ATP-binding protein [Acidimicrobiales bacterium]